MSVTAFTDDEQKAIEEKWTLPRFLIFPAGSIAFLALALEWPSGHWSVLTAWTVFHGYMLFCWTSCFHECAHQTLCGSRFVSIWLGRAIGTVLGVPYTVYRESHIRHHAYLNKPSDWELWPYSDPNTSVAFRRVFVWLDLFLGALTAPYMYGRIYFHRDSPLNAKQRRMVRFEYVGIVAFWSTVLGVVGYLGIWWDFMRVWGFSHLVAGMLQNSRKLTEHLGMSSYDPLAGTRTVISTSWFTKFCTFINFDIFVHGPHHRHPRVAHDQLVKKMDEYVEKHPETEYPVYKSYFAATWNMLPWLFRNPGVGVNAGAAAPEREKAKVEDFVADVTEEVLNEADRLGPPAPKSRSLPKSSRQRVG